MPKTANEYIKEFRDRLGEQEVDYKFREDKILMDIADYVMDTYDPHQTHPTCLLYTSPSPRDRQKSRMPSSA